MRNQIISLMRRGDIILIFLLVGLSFLPLAIFTYTQASVSDTDIKMAVIKQDNEIIKTITLTGHTGSSQFEITSDDGDSNLIEILDERIHIKSATCPDQVCVLTDFIEKPGETIVCIPHKIVIEIQTEQYEEELLISS